MADFIGWVGFVLAILLLIVFVAWLWQANKTGPVDEPSLSEPPKRRAQRDPLRKANDAQDFAQRMQDRARGDIDTPNGGNGNGKHH